MACASSFTEGSVLLLLWCCDAELQLNCNSSCQHELEGGFHASGQEFNCVPHCMQMLLPSYLGFQGAGSDRRQARAAAHPVAPAAQPAATAAPPTAPTTQEVRSQDRSDRSFLRQLDHFVASVSNDRSECCAEQRSCTFCSTRRTSFRRASGTLAAGADTALLPRLHPRKAPAVTK